MATTQKIDSAGKEMQESEGEIMSHEEGLNGLAKMLHESWVYRTRFWNLFRTLRRVEKGEI